MVLASAVQKQVLGVPLLPIGFVVPALIGVIFGALIGYWAHQIERKNDRLKFTLEAATDGLWDYRVASKSIYYSPRWFGLVGYDQGELPASFATWVHLLHPEDRHETLEAFRAVLHHDQDRFSVAHRLHTKSGDWKWVLTTGKVMERDTDGRATRVVGASSDASELKRVESVVKRLEYEDELTSLPNKRAFEERLTGATIRGQVVGSEHSRAIMFIDVDEFTQVNKAYGHATGNELLVEVAIRLRQRLREGDFLSRLGNDEFGLLLGKLHQATDAAIVATKLVQAFDTPLSLDTHTIYTNIRVGIAIYPDDGDDPSHLYRAADAALHEAKLEQVRYKFHMLAIEEEASHRLNIITGLRDALASNGLELHYQPIVDATSQRVVAVEALLRWRTPDQTLHTPDEFLDVAEDSGLIMDIGRWVLISAARQTSRWHGMGYDDLRVNVNVSPLHFGRPEFKDDVSRAVTENELHPGSLCLELTESSFFEVNDDQIKRIDDLFRTGVSFALDDFGTGCSAIDWLRKLPISSLKIDKSFVDCVPSNAVDSGIITSIIGCAAHMKLEVVAEGVETLEQVDFLRESGCGLLQGFYFSKPISAAELERILVAEPSRHISIVRR